MTLQESQLLQDFLNQLTLVHAIPGDPEAQVMIQKAMAQRPDAPYLLVQRSMLLDQALSQAKAQIAQLQQQRGNSPGGGAWNQTPPEPPRNAPPPGNATTAPQPSSGFLTAGAGRVFGMWGRNSGRVGAGGRFLSGAAWRFFRARGWGCLS